MFAATRSVLRTTRPISRYVKPVTASRSYLTLKSPKYTVTAIAQGAGRNGSVSSNGLEFKLATPKEMGGSGDGQNPEQLFAMGYASCFLGALQAVAPKYGKKDIAQSAKIHVSVSLGEVNEKPGFGLEVNIKAEGIDEELLKAAHEFCPYSRLSQEGAVVNVSLA
ncbi:hypothetical protein PM082_000726 [Marasmius tenuissimus]|nr:hypothetical protein PM082_000726 [Marasmius tenuissimus]